MGKACNSKDETMETSDEEIGGQNSSSKDESSSQVNGQLEGQPFVEVTRSNSHVVDSDRPSSAHVHVPRVSLGTASLLQSGPRTLHHSATSPHLQDRPHSTNLPPVFGRILREIGDHYCHSPGIALRQMGDEMSADYEVRRALSTGDIPSAWKHWS